MASRHPFRTRADRLPAEARREVTERADALGLGRRSLSDDPVVVDVLDSAPQEDDEPEDVDLSALEHLIIDLRTSVVHPASPEVAVLHVAEMMAAAKEGNSD